MKTSSKLTPILIAVMALLFIFSPDVKAQTEKKQKAVPQTSVTSTKGQDPTVQSAQPRSTNPLTKEQIAVHYDLLLEKQQLENQLADPKTAEATKSQLKTEIKEIDAKIAYVVSDNYVSKEEELAAKKATPVVKSASSVYDILITEEGILKTRDLSKTYLTLDQFLEASPERQQQVLQNPDQYKVVKHAGLLPVENIPTKDSK